MLTGVIDRFKNAVGYTVTRTAAGSRTAGVWTPGSESTFTIDAVIVPLTGDEVKALPESYHGEELRNVYTTTELKATADDPDYITISGVDFRVFRVQRWDAFGGTHYVATVAREVK